MADGLFVELRQDGPIPLDVSFACGPGETVALVGPSGAGKTTILRAIAGLYRPSFARVACDGVAWDDGADHLPPRDRRVGMVFQSYALFPHLTATGNVEAALTHLASGQRRERAAALLASVRLGGFERRKPAELSGGQQQRVALARALARDPSVLLLDEPLTAVDRRTRRALRAELAALRTSLRCPVVLVTHDLDEAAALADRLLVIDGGTLLQDGTPADVLASPNSRRARDALDLLPAGEGVQPAQQ